MAAINWGAAQRASDRMHASAKDGVTIINKTRYTLTFNHYQGHYEVAGPEGEVFLRYNTRKITEAKRWLREWFDN